VSPVVVDASLAFKWVATEDYTAEAMALLARWQAQQIEPTVPSWFACEIANVLYQEIRANTMTLADAQRNLSDILSAVTVHDFDPATAARALEIAHTFHQRRSYDAHYVALAEHLGCELWTADETFWNATKKTFTRVRWIGEVVV